MQIKSIISASALALALAGAGPTQAQTAKPQGSANNNWGQYAGASIGDSDLGTSLKIFGGAQFHKYIGWEASLINFGEDRRNGPFGTSTEVEAWALGGAVVGLLPITSDLTGLGKLGAYYVRTKARASTPFSSSSSSDSDIELGFGIGLQYRFNRQFSGRVELENYGGEGGDLISVGLQYHF